MSSDTNTSTPAQSHKLWAPLLTLSVQEVFSLMLGSELITLTEPLTSELSVISMVGLAGDLCGLISLRCDVHSARLMASKMLGTEVVDGGPEAIDAVGEVCNMIAGNFKNKIAGLGDGCQLSVPTVISGASYCLRTFSHDGGMECKFLFEGFPLAVSLQVTS